MTSTSMASLISSLSTSFKQVPPVAIPSVLDCVLASTGSSPLAVFNSLIDNFHNFSKHAMEEAQRLGSDQCNYMASVVIALCHLLKKLDTDHDAFQSFMWKCFIPLMKKLHAFEHEMLNQIMESFVDVVIETNTWAFLEESLVPFVLSSVAAPTLGMPNTEGSDNIEQDRSFPLLASCRILSLMLDAALRSFQAGQSSVPISGNGCYSAEKFATSLLWDLCNITERMLLQSVEQRSYGISIFLPIIFKTFDSCNSSEISVDGHTCILSRDSFFKKIWNCCRTLFSLGATERRDAYNILSLCLPYSCPGLDYADRSGREEEFDLRAEKEFWTEIKRGLVDEEGIIRKQSLHILKMVAQVSGENQCYTGVSEKESQEQHPVNKTMTKRERWAAKEAKSLGVGKLSKAVDPGLKGQQQWEAFILLYEMLEEYGTHLVEAAWNHQVTVLLQFSASYDSLSISVAGVHQSLVRSSVDIFDWLSILWERGFRHGNPQVRCIIMQSFLAIEWKIHGDYAKSVPESFVLGPFMEGLNDPVHHKEFGVKGVYCSKTIEAAAQFVHEYTSKLNPRKRVSFLSNLAYIAKRLSFGRVGLMALAECIASAACGAGNHNGSEKELPGDVSLEEVQEKSFVQNIPSNDQSDLLDVLRFVIENSKQHFNPSYRLQVCQKVLEAAVSLVRTFEVPLEILLHFISVLPREFTDYGGSLRASVQNWLLGCGKQHSANCCKSETLLLENLLAFPKNYIRHLFLDDAFVTYDDEDLSAWEFEARRWARVFFLVITEEHHLAPILKFIEEHGIDICKQNNLKDRIPVKFLIFALALVLEIQIMQERKAECGIRVRTRSKVGSMETVDLFTFGGAPIFLEKLASLFSHVLEGLVSFARLSCTIFSSLVVTEATSLPSSVRGKLGGPSQRRLSSSITTTVLQAVVSVKAVASITSWCAQFKTDASLESAYDFMWSFFGKTITSPTSDSETGAEVHLAAYEALASVLKGLISPQALNFISENDKLMLPAFDGRPWLDSWLLTFLQNINAHLAVGVLARTRRAILMNWKWLCLESLLSLPYHVLEVGENVSSFVSDAAVRCVYDDLVESLENAGEGSVLPMLRSIRLTHWLLGSGMLCSVDSTCNGVNSQMMWNLVRSSWILHVSCNKRRVAPIAALLSAVLHPSLFSNEVMHAENEPGPLKWFVENVLEEGTRSPRTIRLAALQLTGLWLSNPKIIKYYMKELKLLTLYGSVAFDEDFEAELAGNLDAKAEVSLLAKSPDPELTEAFINTELYARVSVAVMFYKLGEMVESANMYENCQASLAAGKLFLLELLHFVVNDKDLARELYKKYSAIHRRKVRAWQMICVLSRFVDNEIVGQVTHLLHLSLYRNNLPAVRQYLETFAINIYLKFPSLVEEQLVPILRDYDMRPQALASYVFVAANIILHASKEFQSRHLDELLPPIIPLLTSHHHSLRGFAQLLIYQVLCKLFPSLESATFKIIPLEKRSFEELKLYLAKNSDCARLRASMEGYLDAYDPSLSTTPAGIFINRVEELEFECVPTSLMEQVLSFLNDVREDLRCSMANDTVTIKNESLKVVEDMDSKVCNGDEENSHTQQPRGPSLDFQKKITPSHEKQDKDFRSLIEDRDRSNQLLEMEKEDELFERVLQSRSVAMQKTRASQQHFFLVASFIDRIPNLAGLARTCEVFKASGLAIADANILRDKQFQLISVTAEKWIPVIEVPVKSVKLFLERKKREGYSILGLEQTANSISLDHYNFPKKMVLVLGREKEGIPVDVIHMLDACIEIPQMGVVRSLNVHVSGAIALWEYTRQHRS